jgi:Domain of unknown function (DUF4388)/FHA domain
MVDAVLHGSLASFKLPEVLTFLQITRKSGTLTLTHDERVAYVFFDQGSLVYAGSNQEQFRLGAILLRKKRITPEESTRIDELMRREGGRFGQIAVGQGVLTDAQLQEYLKVQVSEIIYDCFVWDGGTFSFAEELALPNYAVTISIDLSNLIMEGARRIEEWEQCVKLLPDKNVVFRVVSNPSEEKITLKADEWRVLFLINGARTLEDLCHDAQDDPFNVYRVVYGLYANKLIEEVPHDAHADETVRQTGSMPALQDADATIVETAPAPAEDTSLLISSEAKLSYHDVVRPTIAQLTITNGDSQGTVVPLTEPEYLVGRHRENAIRFTDLGISGFHARIFRGPEGYAIEDLKSRNGTWVNNTRVFVHVLKDGDKLRLGATDMTYDVLFSG